MPIVSRLFGPTAKIKDIQGQAKLSKGRKRPEDSITAALVYLFLAGLYFLWMSDTLLGQRAFTYHKTPISKSCKSRACKKKANHASYCDVRPRITRIIWVQSRVTHQILGPSCVTQKPFAILCEGYISSCPDLLVELLASWSWPIVIIAVLFSYASLSSQRNLGQNKKPKDARMDQALHWD